MDGKKEKEEFFGAKMLKKTKYTSLPNLVRLAQWEQVSPFYYSTVKTMDGFLFVWQMVSVLIHLNKHL